MHIRFSIRAGMTTQSAGAFNPSAHQVCENTLWTSTNPGSSWEFREERREVEFFCGSINEMQISSCLSESQQLEGAGPINSDSSEHRTPLVNTGIRLRVEERRIHTCWVGVLLNSLAKLAFGARRVLPRRSWRILEGRNGGRGMKARQTDR